MFKEARIFLLSPIDLFLLLNSSKVLQNRWIHTVKLYVGKISARFLVQYHKEQTMQIFFCTFQNTLLVPGGQKKYSEK